MTEVEIREVFTDPFALKKGIELWRNAEIKPVFNNNVDEKEEVEFKRSERIQKIRNEKQNVKNAAKHMNKLYREDKQLTEVTKSLENEDFHDY